MPQWRRDEELRPTTDGGAECAASKLRASRCHGFSAQSRPEAAASRQRRHRSVACVSPKLEVDRSPGKPCGRTCFCLTLGMTEDGGQVATMPALGQVHQLPPYSAEDAACRLSLDLALGKVVCNGVTRRNTLVPGTQGGQGSSIWERINILCRDALWGLACFHARQFIRSRCLL